jgi:hypothetical protein
VLKKYAKYGRLNAQETVVEITDPNLEEAGPLGKIIDNGFEAGRFNTAAEAVMAMRDEWAEAARNVWIGKRAMRTLEKPVTIIRTMLYDAAIYEARNKQVYVGGAAMAAAETSPLLFGTALGKGYLLAVATAFGMSVVKDKALVALNTATREVGYLIKNNFDSDYLRSSKYTAPNRDNDRRIRRKLDETAVRHLRRLTLDDLPAGGISQDDAKTICAIEEHDWMDRWLISFSNKGWPIIGYDIGPHTQLVTCENGLVVLEHKDKVTNDKTVYAAYIETLDKNDNIAIPDEVKTLLQNHGVIKVTQKEGENSISRETMNLLAFPDELAEFLKEIYDPETKQALYEKKSGSYYAGLL